ncbi:MAG: peptide-N4-asparagine amidase [Steroidobacteraceae bacterium]
MRTQNKKSALLSVLLAMIAGLALPFSAAFARDSGGGLNIPPKPQIGQQNVATADLLVSHPPSEPCIVTLFQSDTFNVYAPLPFTYSPPANCPGPWAKVVFVAHFNENSGVQYDRSAYVFLGNAALYFGTTPEPSSSVGPVWTVERDVTDFSALLAQPQSGAATIFNIVNSTYTGVIHGSGYLYFYPAGRREDAEQGGARAHGGDRTALPSAIYPLNSGNQPTYLDTPAQQLAQQITFPTNMTRIDLQITAQSQIGDEFWYTCVPDQYAQELQSCGNSGYRQVVVQVDGRTVAYAPVSPWIYTGGIDPFLWQPTPGVQTLNFTPYRVDLTPLAAELDNGKPHTVAVSVYNDGNYFSVAATLLVYQDMRVRSIGGAVTDIDVPALAPSVTANLLSGTGGSVSGSVTVSSAVHTRLAGYLELPDGLRSTAVEQDFQFANQQTYTINNSLYDQQIALSSAVRTVTQVSGAGREARRRVSTWRFPLSVNYDQVQQANGDYAITTSVRQHFSTRTGPASDSAAGRALSDRVRAIDTLEFDSGFNFLGHSGMSGSQRYEFERRGDGAPECYQRTIVNSANAVSAVLDGQHCDLLGGARWH